MGNRSNRRNRSRRERAKPKPSPTPPLTLKQAQGLQPLVGMQLPPVVMREGASGRTIEMTYDADGELCPEIVLGGAWVAELADLVAMRVDLDLVVNLCAAREELAKTDEPTFETLTTMQGMSEAAVIAYARGFVKGKSAAPTGGARTPFPRDVLAQLTEQQRETHDKTIDHRHKHVGHRVNDWLQIRVHAVLAPETSAHPGLTTLVERMVTVVQGGPAAERLREVATALSEGLTARIHELEQKIQAEIVGDISPEQLYDAWRKGMEIHVPE